MMHIMQQHTAWRQWLPAILPGGMLVQRDLPVAGAAAAGSLAGRAGSSCEGPALDTTALTPRGAAPAQVHLCGSFTRWVETVPMAPVDGSPGVFSVVVHLPPG